MRGRGERKDERGQLGVDGIRGRGTPFLSLTVHHKRREKREKIEREKKETSFRYLCEGDDDNPLFLFPKYIGKQKKHREYDKGETTGRKQEENRLISSSAMICRV